MVTRIGLLGLGGVLAVGGAAAAGAPAPPAVEGREPTPVVREFYEVEVPPAAFGAVPTFPVPVVGPKGVPDVAALAGFVTNVYDVMMNRFTVPLGTVPVRE